MGREKFDSLDVGKIPQVLSLLKNHRLPFSTPTFAKFVGMV
jgi:hypothetical protein